MLSTYMLRKGEFDVRMFTSLKTFDSLVVSIIGVKKESRIFLKTGYNFPEL